MSVKERDVITVQKGTVRFQSRGQITIPKTMANELGLEKGDILEARLEDGHIVLVPTVSVPKDQAWYWTPEWQAEEREAEDDVRAGRMTTVQNAEELDTHLKSLGIDRD